MFWFNRVTPSFSEFTIAQLTKYEVLSDEELMDKFWAKYCRWFRPSQLAKKLESYRKRLSGMRKDGKLVVVERIKRPIKSSRGNFESQEIFFQLK